MELKYYKCEMCCKTAVGEKKLRRNEWLEIEAGGTGIRTWLEKPRKGNNTFIHQVGMQNREYHFCSIECLCRALRATDSM